MALCHEKTKSPLVWTTCGDLKTALADLQASHRFAPLVAEIAAEAQRNPLGPRSVLGPRVSGAAPAAAPQAVVPRSVGKKRPQEGDDAAASCGAPQAKRQREEDEDEDEEALAWMAAAVSAERAAAPKRAGAPPSGAAPPKTGMVPVQDPKGVAQKPPGLGGVNQGPGMQAPQNNNGPPPVAYGQAPAGGVAAAQPQYQYGGGGPNAGQQQQQVNGGGPYGGVQAQVQQQPQNYGGYGQQTGGGLNAGQQQHGSGARPTGGQMQQQQAPQPQYGGAGGPNAAGQRPWPQQPVQQQYKRGYGVHYPPVQNANATYRQNGVVSSPAPVQRPAGPVPAPKRPAGNGMSAPAPAPTQRAPAAPTCPPPKCICSGGGVRDAKAILFTAQSYGYVCQDHPGGCGFQMKAMEYRRGAAVPLPRRPRRRLQPRQTALFLLQQAGVPQVRV
jgi:hypothetical protein